MPPLDLLFAIDPGEAVWTVIGPTSHSPPHLVPSPLEDTTFRWQLTELRTYASQSLLAGGKGSQRIEREMFDLANEISVRITALLFSDAARPLVLRRLNEVHRGRPRLTVRISGQGFLGDQILALPWELVAPAPGSYPVRQSRLEVVRESVVEGAPELPEPSGPLALAVAVAAPEEQAALAYEKEELRLQTALAPLGHAVAFSDLGTLRDLVDLTDEHRATAILFSGHGLPGQLLFENELGLSDPVGVEEVLRRLHTVLLKPGRGDAFPRLFFLSSCHGATGADGPGAGGRASLLGDGPSTAATLHRAGFPQVIGYFGSVRDSQAGRAEATFFQALARGETALQAAHEARASLVDPFEIDGARFSFPLGWTQLAVYHRGPDRPIALGGPRRGRALPPRFRRRTEERNGLPVLLRGFVGRRGLQHELLRRARSGERLLVLQAPAGEGKTALACHLLTRTLAPEPPDLLLLRTCDADAADLSAGLRLQAEEHGLRHAFPGWEERLRELREVFPDATVGFAATVLGLRAARPNLAVYVDRTDAMQAGPAAEGEDSPGSWKPGAEAAWRGLEELAAEEDIPILVSTRFAAPDLAARTHLAVSPLSPADSLRMMSFFVELADLSPEHRRQLADWADGHPRTIELLDRALERGRQRLGLGAELTEPWSDLVAPALGEVAEEVRAESAVEQLWRGLPEGARDHARRLARAGAPLALGEVDALGSARDVLIRRGLLVCYRGQVRSGSAYRWQERWGLPLRIREWVAAECANGNP